MPFHIQFSDDFYGVSLCSYTNQFVFVSGGESSGTKRDKVVRLKVDKMDLEANNWEVMPSLNVARSLHSSCALSNALYVIGGYAYDDNPPIEKLSNPGSDVQSMRPW